MKPWDVLSPIFIQRGAIYADQLRKKAASLSLPQTLKIRDDF
jgi:hypothetical protein